MKLYSQIIISFLLAITLITPANAVQTDQKTAMLSQLMKSVADNDFVAFQSNGTEQFKKTLNEKAFASVANQLSDVIKAGYKAEYLTHLSQKGNKVHVWKLSYKVIKDTMLVKLVIIDNKVAGFWIQ